MKLWQDGDYSEMANFSIMLDSIKLTLILLGIRVKLLSGMKVFIQYVIIIYQNWTIYMYVALVLKETTTDILYKFPNFVRR